MARNKRSPNTMGGPNIDYYEYKRQRDLRRMKNAPSVEQPTQRQTPIAIEEDKPEERSTGLAINEQSQTKKAGAKIFGGIKNVVDKALQHTEEPKLEDEPFDFETLDMAGTTEEGQPDALNLQESQESIQPADMPASVQSHPVDDIEVFEDADTDVDLGANPFEPAIRTVKKVGDGLKQGAKFLIAKWNDLKTASDQEDQDWVEAEQDEFEDIEFDLDATLESDVEVQPLAPAEKSAEKVEVFDAPHTLIVPETPPVEEEGVFVLEDQDLQDANLNVARKFFRFLSKGNDTDSDADEIEEAKDIAESEPEPLGFTEALEKAKAFFSNRNKDKAKSVQADDDYWDDLPDETESVAVEGQIKFDFEDIGAEELDIEDIPAAADENIELSFNNEDGGEGMDEKDRSASASLTELLAADLDDQPVPSRRARKAGGSKQTAAAVEQPALADTERDDVVTADIWESDIPVDEPTLEFKPLRQPDQQPSRRAVEQEDESVRTIPSRSKRERMKPEPDRRQLERRVYSDDDYDNDYDYDDYDDDYDDDDDDRVGIGHFVLGFFKTIILIGLICLLIVLGLRQMESSGILSLNWLRDLVGDVVPIENIFPEPQGQPQQPQVTPATEGQTPDEQQSQQQPAEQPAEQPAQPAAEQQPAEQQPAEQQPAEQQPVEEQQPAA